MMSKDAPWWQTGIIYQVYPRSFQDSNGDGVGDIKGIEQRLQHVVDLGADAIWISPVFPSPMRDFGYDVSSYCDIDPIFGTLSDFDQLLASAHACGLKVILDFVPNHSSDQHPWFKESRSSRDNPQRDWYIWRDAKPDGSAPNNWESEFGGSAWTFDAVSGQFYYHAYLAEQPDLNWRHPGVRKAMLDVLRFWLDRGVDGFRVDAIHHLLEDAQFRDNPENPAWRPGMPPNERWLQIHTVDQPAVHAAIKEMRAVADVYPDRVMIGEAYLPIDRLMAYYGADLTGFHLPFNFHLISTAWRPDAVAALIEQYEQALPAGGWPNWVLGNHDRSRVASRIGQAQARVAAMLLLTLRGTPTIYQGEELGMMDVRIPPHLVQDPWEKNVPGLGLGRDPERSPIPWAPGPGCGFTTGRPWLPVETTAGAPDVQTQAGDVGSMLSLYRALIDLRRSLPALAGGAYKLVNAGHDILCYERYDDATRILMALNMTGRPQALSLNDPHEILLSTSTQRNDHLSRGGSELRLQANEGLILQAVHNR